MILQDDARRRQTDGGRTLRCNALAALLLVGNAVAQKPPHDCVIVPGVRVGPITASSTEASLREAFGQGAVITERVHGDFDTGERVTLVHRDDPSLAVAVTWVGNAAQNHPGTVLFFCLEAKEAVGPWRTGSGIGCGTTLRQLEALNGRPFTLSGYGGDLGGTVMSWRGGELEAQLGSKGGALEISIAPNDRRWRDRLSEADLVRLKRDTLQSDDPMIHALNPVVYRMVFRFAGASK